MKSKNIIYAAILISLQLCNILCAQPTAFTHAVESLGSVEAVVPEPIDLETVLMEDHQRNSQGGPYRFAVARPVEVTPETEGMWEEIDKETLLWRLPIASPGAISLNLGFTSFFLPPGSRLYIYSADHSEVLGPFTEDDNKEHGQLWTPLIRSDAIIVELTIPVSGLPQLELELTSINHGYQRLDATYLFAVGDSNDCRVNVACPEGNLYRNQIRSVAWYTFNGTGACTGSLINNTAQNDRPYFLTAFHCFDNDKNEILNEVEKEAAKTMVVYWNDQASTCEGSEVSDIQTQQSAIFRAGHRNSDFALVELEDIPPYTADVYYAGWDRSNTVPLKGIAIHHPQKDLKKINIENDPLYQTSTLAQYGSRNILYEDFFEVCGWDVGMTEDSSSGCPLFNSNGRVVAQLASASGKCETQSSWFGPLYMSWTGGGTSDTRLRDWLDPGNAGMTFLDGKNPARRACDIIAIGVGTELHTIDFPMATGDKKSRTQVIYLADEIGQPGSITGLALNVLQAPTLTMNNWTIRMKHTAKSQYSTYSLEPSGWTQVYRKNESINETGWKWFEFQTPFEYNGVENLIVDFSHNNSDTDTSGRCLWSRVIGKRGLPVASNTSTLDPLDWSRTMTDCYELIPNIKLNICGSWEQKLIAPDGAAVDQFGRSVSISGDYAIIGAPYHDSAGSDSGAAYVFKRSGAKWTYQDKLQAYDLAAGDLFGWSVSIDGDYAIIGSSADFTYVWQPGGSLPGRNGVAYIFKRNGELWDQQQKLEASDTEPVDRFGCSVSINGDYAIIGAEGDRDNGAESGSAYIFKREGNHWNQQDKVIASDGSFQDLFGNSVSLSGDNAIVGAAGADVYSGWSGEGAAYIFKRSGNSWIEQTKLIQQTELTAGGGASSIFPPRFGWSVSISEDYALVGVISGFNYYRTDSGSAYISWRNEQGWSQPRFKLTASDGELDDEFGGSVSGGRDYMIVGAPGDDDNGVDSGSAYIFKGGFLQEKVIPSDGTAGANFGYSVSINGSNAIVGAPGDDFNKGSAYIFKP